MDFLQQDGSAYLNDADYHSNSPASVQLNVSPHQSPFDTFEFSVSNQIPHTPSYNGSYQGSPYSAHSELSFDVAEPFNLFDDQPSDTHLREDYDPTEYDGPNASTLLMFDNNPYLSSIDDGQVSVSVVPPPVDHLHTFDYSSPSSNGGGDSGAEGEARSRASSISSNPHLPSPRLDVAHSFEKMGLRTPSWGTSPLPSDRPISPPDKPQSPPQLLIPDMTSPGPTFAQPPPTINAPAGDGGLMASGPQLHIVPATPVTGGTGVATATPFQQRLQQESVHDGQQQSVPQGWTPHAHEDQDPLGIPHFRDTAQVSYGFQQHSHHDNSGLSTSNAQIHPNEQQSNTDYLLTLPSRMRSKSETSLHPPQWDTVPFLSPHHPDSAIDDGSSTINLNEILTAPDDHSQLSQPSTARPRQTSSGQYNLSPDFGYGQPMPPSQFNSSHNFLSPDFGLGIRRSQSDAGGRRGGHRQSRSEDVRHSSSLLYPPSSQHTQDIITRQFLHPQPPRGPGHRRASSGSRGERPGTWSNSSSQRASPYPSPSASPGGRYHELPAQDSDPLVSGKADIPVVSKPTVTTGRTANASIRRRTQEANFLCPVPGCGSTFTRSFNLKGHLRSHNDEKPFQCKWPGCGKGFARQHDCKRHEQLHSNYRPFICEGCSKPFARMDALNRHLRSEGGADCSKMLGDAGRDPAHTRAYKLPPDLPQPKLEPDALGDHFDDLTRMSIML